LAKSTLSYVTEQGQSDPNGSAGQAGEFMIFFPAEMNFQLFCYSRGDADTLDQRYSFNAVLDGSEQYISR
jgi:hypothetical protein